MKKNRYLALIFVGIICTGLILYAINANSASVVEGLEFKVQNDWANGDSNGVSCKVTENSRISVKGECTQNIAKGACLRHKNNRPNGKCLETAKKDGRITRTDTASHCNMYRAKFQPTIINGVLQKKGKSGKAILACA